MPTVKSNHTLIPAQPLPLITFRFAGSVDPMTLPNVIAELPEKAANSDTASSGALVPNATVVKPMIIVDTPSRCRSRFSRSMRY